MGTFLVAMLLLATGNYAEKLFLRKFGVVKGAIFSFIGQLIYAFREMYRNLKEMSGK
jgi:uncharacterized protein YqgC (DUF456 family)